MVDPVHARPDDLDDATASRTAFLGDRDDELDAG